MKLKSSFFVLAASYFQFIRFSSSDDSSQSSIQGITKSVVGTASPSFNNMTDIGRGRAMNLSFFLHGDHANGIQDDVDMSSIPSAHLPKEHRLDDVSIDENDEDFDNFNMSSIMPQHFPNNEVFAGNLSVIKNMTTDCFDKGKTYKLGEKFNRGCDEICQCLKGSEIICSAQCKPPYFKKGHSKKDNSCTEQPVESNPCCVILKCPASNIEIGTSSEHNMEEHCTYKNETHKIGTTFNDGCEAVCLCEIDGKISCKPRCPIVKGVGKSCITLPDMKDPCCPVVLCDVEDHEVNKIGATGSDESLLSSMSDNQLISAVATNSTSVRLTFADKSASTCEVEMSSNGIEWNKTKCADNTIGGLQPGKTYHFRLKNNLASNTVQAVLPNENLSSKSTCEYKGKTYNRGEEFHDGCEAYCICDKTGVECAPIECPTDFGLDVLDPQCIDWETHPAGFVPTPPNCCPDKVHCRNNGSCTYNGENFPNWSEIPTKLSGCEKRCYCELGNVTCQQLCPKVPTAPPATLPCSPQQAILTHMPGDDCCLFWICPNIGGKLNGTLKNGTNASNTIPFRISVTDKIASKNEFPPPSFIIPMTLPPSMTHADFASDVIPISITSKPYFKPTLNTNNNNNNLSKNSEIPPFKNITFKKPAYYPGPFSPQFIESKDHNNSKIYSKEPHKSSHHLLTELLTPFHLEEFIPQIEKDLHENDTTVTKKPNLSTKIPHRHFSNPYDDMDEGNDDIDIDDDHNNNYDEEQELFSGIFDPNKSPGSENTHKQNLWTLKPDLDEITKKPDLTGFPHQDITTKGEVLSEQSTLKHSGIGESNKMSSNKKQETINLSVKNEKQNEHNPPHILLNPYGGSDHTNFVNVDYKYPHSKIQIQPPNNKIQGQVQSFSDLLKQKFKPTEGTTYHIIDETPVNGQFNPFNVHPSQLGHPPGSNGVLSLHKVRGQFEHNFPYHQFEYPSTDDEAAHPIPGSGGHQHFENHSHQGGLPDQDLIPNYPSIQGHLDSDIKIHILEPLSDNVVKLVFSVPAYLVGLHGRVELRYTADKQNSELSTWDQQILAPPNDLIATQELEFELGGLQPNTTYKIKISVNMHDIENMPSSEVLTVRTLPKSIPTTTLPPIIPIEADLRMVEVNSTWAKLTWRVFTDFELQLIDGIQLRFKELDDKVYSATPLIHRAVNTYIVENLKSDSIYEFGIFFIPFTGQTTELQAQRTLQVRTTIENDPYKFDLILDVHHIKATSVELSWSGIPYPEDKYVNIFRAIYQTDGNREDFNSFKVAKRDSPQSILIQDLKPNSRYRLWLEGYLTNGRIKKSNVKDFITKTGTSTQTIKQGKLELSPLIECNSYYGPLVGVSIFAALAICAALILILILAKKHATNKAPITNPIHARKNNTSAAYDNPSYKICDSNDKSENNSKAGSIPLAVFQVNGKHV